jgi:hypothetical protein
LKLQFLAFFDRKTAYSVANIVLVSLGVLFPGWFGLWCVFLTSFFMSLMFPTIFALGLRGLGAEYQDRRLLDCHGNRRRRGLEATDGIYFGEVPQHRVGLCGPAFFLHRDRTIFPLRIQAN